MVEQEMVRCNSMAMVGSAQANVGALQMVA